ncbi:MAG: FAD-dependent oxidoreductase [Lachnospiraceae bacterium]|jgi:pyruvate/2-oxoglutarate dehydrogenase complex dihydrolipoamide dehydrogenase (E3) component|nr:FAD-dependent oxidoreductase [Lachnospiraceae bacterium]
MERKYENIIIGFGKGGKTLAGALAKAGQSTVLIEKDPLMYGGTCINVACIPTKSLENSARLSAAIGGDFEDKARRYTEAVAEKGRLTGMLRSKNYDKAVAAGVKVLTGSASFTDSHTVKVTYPDGRAEELTGERIFINTGSRPFLPPIDGLKDSRFVYTSEQLMERNDLPRRLTIIGGGYIGLEFSSYFTNFGSEVTIIQDGETFIPREDAEIAKVVYDNLTSRGVSILRSAKTTSVRDEADHAVLTVSVGGEERQIEADAVLVAAGRRPNLEGLDLQAAGVELTERGAVKTNEHLQTSVPHIWAMGDVVGGMQFTYISLDDYRIVSSAVLGDGSRTTANRGAVPYTVFLDPPMSRVGLSEAEALAKGLKYRIARIPAAAIPKAQVLKKPEGLLKAIVDADTGMILGAHFFCAESQEMINLVKLCMDNGLPYTVLRDNIYNHPTMTEALNDLFAAVR